VTSRSTGFSADDLTYVTALVRESDRPRYYATLFAPADLRADLFALFGFAAEVARIPDQVSEPGLGEIRLRWWQDSLAEATAPGGAGNTPVLRAIAATMARHRLPLEPFVALMESRAADLYSDAPASLPEIEGRLGETESVLFQMAAIILGARGSETPDASGHAGIAYGVVRRLAIFASDRARGRFLLPADLLAEHGLRSEDLLSPQPPGELVGAIRALSDFARRHLRLAQGALAGLDRSIRLAFLPLAIVQPMLRRIEGLGIALAFRDAELSDLQVLARIAAARLRL